MNLPPTISKFSECCFELAQASNFPRDIKFLKAYSHNKMFTAIEWKKYISII